MNSLKMKRRQLFKTTGAIGKHCSQGEHKAR